MNFAGLLSNFESLKIVLHIGIAIDSAMLHHVARPQLHK